MTTSTIPAAPICLAEDGVKPCPYWQHCHETRQRIQSGQRMTEGGRWLTVNPPLRGAMCWAYDQARCRGVTPATEPITIARREPGEEPF